jgi:colanic acid/amylovoran biosynthesis glycosyltransferase
MLTTTRAANRASASAHECPNVAPPLSVAYVVEAYETFIVEEIAELRRQGCRVTVLNAFRPVPLPDPAKERMREGSLYFPPRYKGVMRALAARMLLRPRAFLRALHDLGRQGSLQMYVLGVYYASLIERYGIHHVHGTFGTRTSTLASLAANLAGVAFSFTTHAYDLFEPNPTLVWKTRRAAFMRTISQFNKRYLIEKYPALDPAKIHVNYLGVDLKRFAPAPWRPGGGRFRLLSVGRLVATKGHCRFVTACADLARSGLPISATIIGEGTLRGALEQMIQAHQLTGIVRLAGGRSQAEVLAALRDADAFVLLCRRSEVGDDQDGIPVALMEAMAMGLPVVSTFVSGVPELVTDGVTGILVPPDDPPAAAAAIGRLMADPALSAAMGQAARRTIEQRFDLTTNTGSLLQLYDRFTPGRHPGMASA